MDKKIDFEPINFASGIAAAHGRPDWTYRDMPNMLPATWELLMAVIGAENVEHLTHAERTWPNGEVTVRGQVLISPEGIRRVAEYRDAPKGQA